MRSSKRLAFLTVLLAARLGATISIQTAWEVRPSLGASTNGGGYVAGTTATTTDYSIFDNKNAAACSNCGSSTQDLSTADAVSNGTTTVTSAGANFVAVKGNIVYFQGGTGAIAAVRRQVVSVTNTTTIVLDASIAASATMTMNIGGSLDTLATALLSNVTDNAIWIKATGTITTTASITLNVGVNPTFNVPPNRLYGYTTTRGDNGFATIELSTNTGLTALNASGSTGWWIRNIIIDCKSLGTSIGINSSGNGLIQNVKVRNCTTAGIRMQFNSGGVVMDTEVSGCSGSGAIDSNVDMLTVWNCYIHDNTTAGLIARNGTRIVQSIFDTNTGNHVTYNQGSSGTGIEILNNVFYASGADAINLNGSAVQQFNLIRGNIIVNNTGWGIDGSTSAGGPAGPAYDGNAYFNNTAGDRRLMDDTTVNPINGVGAYTNIYDVSLSGDPFTNAGAGDFTLNNTVGAGAACKAAGPPTTILGATGTSLLDKGVYQSTGTGTGGTNTVGCGIRN